MSLPTLRRPNGLQHGQDLASKATPEKEEGQGGLSRAVIGEVPEAVLSEASLQPPGPRAGPAGPGPGGGGLWGAGAHPPSGLNQPLLVPRLASPGQLGRGCLGCLQGCLQGPTQLLSPPHPGR